MTRHSFGSDLGGSLRHTTLAVTLFAVTLCIGDSGFGQTTVSFQQGVDGYDGTFDIIVGGDDSGVPGGAFGNILGADIEENFLDGRYFDVDPGGNNADDKQLLIRFDDIIGLAAGQIPLGASIQQANLVITTGASSSNARSGGPYGVSQMLVQFDDLSAWVDFDDVGPTVQGGFVDRPLDRGFRGPMEASVTEPSPQFADVTRIVQKWSDGMDNEGFAVRAGTTDGWQIFTTGVLNEILRPRLEVTYDTLPQPVSETVTLQQDVNGYTGTTMARLNDDDITDDGSLFEFEFLDGPNLAGTSPDDQLLIRFDGIFQSEGGDVPDDALILDSQLIIDTAPAGFNANVGTNGNYSVHQMLVDWDLNSIYSDFGLNGPEVDNGAVAESTDLTGSMIADARTHLDVTESVRAWQSGESNFGLNVQAADTSDGWAIQWLNSFSPPQLVITYTEDVVQPQAGDYDGDGFVGQGDIDLVLLNWGADVSGGAPAGWTTNLPMGSVDQDELDAVLLNWGSSGAAVTAAATPEPATWLLALLAAVAAFFVSRQR